MNVITCDKCKFARNISVDPRRGDRVCWCMRDGLPKTVAVGCQQGQRKDGDDDAAREVEQ